MNVPWLNSVASKIARLLELVGLRDKSSQLFIFLVLILFFLVNGSFLAMYRTGVIFPDMRHKVVYETSFHADFAKSGYRATRFFHHIESDVIPKNSFQTIFRFPRKPQPHEFMRARYEVYSRSSAFCLFAWVEPQYKDRISASAYSDIYVEFSMKGQHRLYPLEDVLRDGYIYIDEITSADWPDDVHIFFGLTAGENPEISGNLRYTAITMNYLRTVECT